MSKILGFYKNKRKYIRRLVTEIHDSRSLYSCYETYQVEQAKSKLEGFLKQLEDFELNDDLLDYSSHRQHLHFASTNKHLIHLYSYLIFVKVLVLERCHNTMV